MGIDRDIADFFRTYVDAFARDDIDAVCRAWLFPALIMAPAGNAMREEAPFRDNGVKLMAFYRAQGMASVEGRVLETEILFPGAAKARVAYRLADSSGAEIVSWQHVYLLRLTPAGWRTAVSIADGETAAWTARGVSLGG